MLSKIQIGILLFIQILFLIFFLIWVRHYPSEHTVAMYPAYQDVHVMIFIGFGFLMVFLKSHSWTSAGLNMLIAAWAMQATILFRGFWRECFDGSEITPLNKEPDTKIHIPLNLESMGEADFGAAVVLITFGAVLGKVTAFQMCILALIELFFYTLNQAIAGEMGIRDVGGSMIVHMFGAFFGIALTKALSTPDCSESANLKDGKISNTMAMIGTVFLWIYWPSFNGFLAGSMAEYAYINTVLALIGSCTIVFFLSALFNGGKFNMEDVLNATLAGGVAMGTTADLITKPGVGLLIGILGGVVSIVGYKFITPGLLKTHKFHDTCGVTNLHGLPGLLASIISWIAIPTLDDELFDDQTASGQGAQQFWYCLITLCISLITGFITGKIVKPLGPTKQSDFFTDALQFNLPEEEEEQTELKKDIEKEKKDEENQKKEDIQMQQQQNVVVTEGPLLTQKDENAPVIQEQPQNVASGPAPGVDMDMIEQIVLNKYQELRKKEFDYYDENQIAEVQKQYVQNMDNSIKGSQAH